MNSFSNSTLHVQVRVDNFFTSYDKSEVHGVIP